MALSLNFKVSAETTENELSPIEELSSEENKTISNQKYIAGGLTAMIPGFGIGHAIQGRYMERGWIFTAGELVTLSGMVLCGSVATGHTLGVWLPGVIFGSLFEDKSFVKELTKENDRLNSNMRSLSLALLTVFIGFKFWEAVDTWMLPSNYKVVKEAPFQIQPLAFYDRNDSLSLGLSLNYKF